MQSLKIHGQMGEYHSAIVKYFEAMADVKVEKKEK
jgi:2-hydroxy-3-oxopropionate reductase